MKEQLTKALQSAEMASSDLRAALHDATEVEALMLLDLIRYAADLEQRIRALALAVNGRPE